jgi:hypothetical protein
MQNTQTGLHVPFSSSQIITTVLLLGIIVNSIILTLLLSDQHRRSGTSHCEYFIDAQASKGDVASDSKCYHPSQNVERW